MNQFLEIVKEFSISGLMHWLIELFEKKGEKKEESRKALVDGAVAAVKKAMDESRGEVFAFITGELTADAGKRIMQMHNLRSRQGKISYPCPDGRTRYRANDANQLVKLLTKLFRALSEPTEKEALTRSFEYIGGIKKDREFDETIEFLNNDTFEKGFEDFLSWAKSKTGSFSISAENIIEKGKKLLHWYWKISITLLSVSIGAFAISLLFGGFGLWRWGLTFGFSAMLSTILFLFIASPTGLGISCLKGMGAMGRYNSFCKRIIVAEGIVIFLFAFSSIGAQLWVLPLLGILFLMLWGYRGWFPKATTALGIIVIIVWLYLPAIATGFNAAKTVFPAIKFSLFSHSASAKTSAQKDISAPCPPVSVTKRLNGQLVTVYRVDMLGDRLTYPITVKDGWAIRTTEPSGVRIKLNGQWYGVSDYTMPFRGRKQLQFVGPEGTQILVAVSPQVISDQVFNALLR